MYKIVATTICFLALSQTAFARQGENDSPDRQDDGAMIVCTEAISGATVLQFMSTSIQGSASTSEYQLDVKARGDDIGEMFLIDKRSGDSVKAKSLEELLKVTLTTDEGTTPTVVESTTRRGFAELQVIDATSQDKALVKSLSRRSVSKMELTLTSNENPGQPIALICQKLN